MRKALALFLAAASLCAAAAAQTATPTEPQNQQSDEEVVRITTQLIQVDAVVTDKNDQAIPDLKPGDFSVYDNGKKQDLQFIEYVSGGTNPRLEGDTNLANQTAGSDLMRNVSAQNLHRVFAFVVDDLTIPIADIVNVRAMLTDFVDKQMRDDDLVAIVRVVGGRGLLEQFTSDKALLRRAIAEITPVSSPYSAFNNLPTPERIDKFPQPMSSADGGAGGGGSGVPSVGSGMDYDATPDAATQGMRALSALAVTGNLVDSMKPLPGRKSVVLISGGIPVFDSSRQQANFNGAPLTIQESRSISSNVTSLLNRLTDRASRAGVVINTMDIRGLSGLKGVSGFNDPGNEARSGLMTSANDSSTRFGRTADLAQFDNLALDTLTGHQGLEALAAATGGVSVVNTNNFREGLDRVVGRSSYYILAYRPSEPFDGKFHKLQIKVDRPGAKVYTRVGYVAKADEPAPAQTKEQAIVRAAMSPLARRDVDVTGALQYRFTPDNVAAIDIDLRVDAGKLGLKQGADGKYHASLDVVGFLIDRTGKTQGGFSQTINASLSPDEYKRALDAGIGYTGHVDLPPGSYQLRAVVRDADTGRLGTLSKYIEVPDMSKRRFTMSSVFLHAVAPGSKQGVPLTALRQISRKDDLRFSAVVYNPKLDHGKSQLSTQLVIARPDKVIFNGPVQAVEAASPDGAQVAKVGQIGLGKLQPGHYTLTFIITDALADKKTPPLARTIDFNVVE